MKMARVIQLRYKELMIIYHALCMYINREVATEEDIRVEADLLDRIYENINLMRVKK